MSYISVTPHAYAFRGVPKLVKAKYFLGFGGWGPVQRGYFAKNFSFNQKEIGYQSGYFFLKRKDDRPMSLIYTGLLEIDGGETVPVTFVQYGSLGSIIHI